MVKHGRNNPSRTGRPGTHAEASMRRHSPAVRPRGLPSALVFLLIGLIAAGARTPSGPLTPGEFETWLRSVLSEPALSRAFVGIHIVRAEDGATIAAYNAGKLFHPASNMKLLTTAAALALLPGDFSFRTELFADARIEDSVLRGNLYVRGGGDPLADTLDIDSLAAIVGGAGIRRIEGDLVGDVSIFDTVGWGKGWMWDDEPDPDEAFISALTFNRNAVTVTVAPAGRAGEPLAVTLAPEPAYFAIDNLSVTGGRREPDSVGVRRVSGTNRIVVEGTMSAASAPREVELSVFAPADFFLEALRSALAARGIVVQGKSRPGAVGGPVFLGRTERPLVAVLDRVNKISDNIAAENLLKILGAETAGPPGSAKTGLRAVAAYLGGAGIDSGSTILADGSGVSWYNAVTPGDITMVLTDQYRRQGTFGRFLASLPVAGMDGTLKNRHASTDVRGRISAKTGTITGVSTLSGYAFTYSGELLAFSMMFNHYPGDTDGLRAVQDSVMAEILRLRADPPADK